MVADAGPARSAILPILHDVDLAAIPEGDDAKAANRVIPKDFAVLASGALERVNLGFGNSSRRHFPLS